MLLAWQKEKGVVKGIHDNSSMILMIQYDPISKDRASVLFDLKKIHPGGEWP